MNNLQCSVIDGKGKRCGTSIFINRLVSESVRFICKNHSDAVQRRAAGNTKVARPDVLFQETQFDPDLQQRTGKPEGTSHIDNQGDKIMDSEQIRAALDAVGITRGE